MEMTAKDTLIDARKRYAASPSHAGPADFPEPGTYCPITAICGTPNPAAQNGH